MMMPEKSEFCILGMMSGTSGDGIDGVLVEFNSDGEARLVWHDSFEFPAEQFVRIQRLMKSADAAQITVGNAYIAELYSQAFRKFLSVNRQHPDFIAAHGQTIFHQPHPENWDGIAITGSLQLMDGCLLAERARTPVICNFRSADMSVGGQGAPLVPFADLFLLGNKVKQDFAVVNIGGMANITCVKHDVNLVPNVKSAFDTGPGNVLMDLFLQSRNIARYDDDGRIAASGKVCLKVVDEFLLNPYFLRKPPKSTGREYFNATCLETILQAMPYESSNEDIMATLLEITVRSIVEAVFSELGRNGKTEILVAGGGALNSELMRRMSQISEGNAVVASTNKYGIPVMAREAMAFAVLGYCFLKRCPSNVIAATGAAKEVVLGQFHPVPSDLSWKILSD